MAHDAHPRPNRSFGRIQARALKPAQAEAVARAAAAYAIAAEGPLDLRAMFPEADRRALEIGFGGGEHLVGRLAADPGLAALGCEPFLNGYAKCLVEAEALGLRPRLRLHQGDVRALLPRMPDASVGRVYVLFPDPWPKARHWKRRLIQAEVVGELARVLEPGGDVRFATDWRAYAAWTLEAFLREPRFAWLAETARDWREPWPGHIATRYELKRLGDCAPIFLRFQRR